MLHGCSDMLLDLAEPFCDCHSGLSDRFHVLGNLLGASIHDLASQRD
jgi:hypothetical protein